MKIRTGYMRLLGLAFLAGAVVAAMAANWNRNSESVCQSIENVQAQLGTPETPPGCGPVNYALTAVLACIGAGLILASFFFVGSSPGKPQQSAKSGPPKLPNSGGFR